MTTISELNQNIFAKPTLPGQIIWLNLIKFLKYNRRIETDELYSETKAMPQILQATCINGNLVLSEPLNPQMEGKHLNVIIQVATEADQAEMPTADQKFVAFINHAKQFSAKLPANYKFNREELYER